MLSLFFNAALAADRTQTAETYWELWQNWHKSGERWLPEIVTAEEHDSRFEIFMDNVDRITRHNAAGETWTMGITPFSDMTSQEFKDKVITNVCEEHFASSAKLNAAKTKLRQGRRRAITDVPASVDWTTVTPSVVTAVKNQGQCGSCWAFSTAECIESQWAIKTGELRVLSEQELVDCDTADSGCGGGSMQSGFQFAVDHKGLCLESDYSYTGEDGTCQTSCTPYDAITSYTAVTATAEALMEAVAKGPTSIAIEADTDGFQLYTGGIFTSTCGTQLDHGVVAVGYGTDSTGDYWLVRNSWGTGWGDNGYIKLCRNCDKNDGAGQCGINLDASYANA